MDFGFTEEQDKFRQEVRAFLSRELPAGGEEGGAVDEASEEGLALHWVMARKLGERGWLSLTWPREYGGQARPMIDHLIFGEEYAYHAAQGVDRFGGKMLAPVLIRFGSEEQKKKYLPPIARGEVRWCQGFSEPGAGSDLASLQMRAVEQEDCFVVNGQKVWTSFAQVAEWCFFLARTDVDAPKHRGITFFLVDCKNTPGITVRPVIGLDNMHRFNEVYFDDVYVPKENIVGEKNQGWYVAAALLDFERSGIERPALGRRYLEQLIRYAHETKRNGVPLAEDKVVKQKLAELAIEIEVSRLFSYRVGWMQSQGLVPNYEASMAKLYGTELIQRIANVGLQVMGLYGQLEPGSKWAALGGDLELQYMHGLGGTIAAGTSEVQRNIIATRGLGLPR